MITSKLKTVWSALLILLLGMGLAARLEAGVASFKLSEQKITLGGKDYVVSVPEGYVLELLSTALDGPRMLHFAPDGVLFIGSKSGQVYRLAPPYTKVQTWVRLNDYPHSLALRGDYMLIAQKGGLYRAPYRAGEASIDAGDVKLIAPLPGGMGHSSRTVTVGPDGRVYVSLGISGNCSDEYLGEGYDFDDRRGGVLVLIEEKKDVRWETYASGLRNPVGLDWHPRTGELYATNNGPDHLGFEQPPEYFSRVMAGSFHGMPWFQYDGKTLRRDDCVSSAPPRPMTDVVLPVATFPSRNAPLGMAFVPKGGLEPHFEFDAVVALHGSWGTKPNGGFFGRSATRRPPALVVVRFEQGEAKKVEDLITGFQLPDGERWARPAGVAVGPDGALYFTSDSDTQGLFRLSRKP